MLDFSQFECLTFDCYGTLIDWESGILAAVRPILDSHHRRLSDDGILELFAAIEAEEETGDYKKYRQVLQRVMWKMSARIVFPLTEAELNAFPNSLPTWPVFSDTVEALRRLKSNYKLGVISNIDNDLFAETAKALQVPFDFVNTAEQARSYKPSLNNFHLAVERIGMPKEKILHCAQSIYHDIVPARELGIANVWVNRRAGKRGSGATRAAVAQSDVEVPDLKALAELAKA
ncbi:MAG TPA: haloacid dehalogenase type II [Terriglobales bacterium]|nr:haloacid dehalogenase type II [Terriglobales bacterium]